MIAKSLARQARPWSLAVILVTLAAFFGLIAILATMFSPDEFYYRFTTPRAHSLIFGTSRAAQGIKPEVLNGGSLPFDGPIFNFSFTIGSSRPGPWFFGVVEKKLAPPGGDGLFIMEVSPRSMSDVSREDGRPERVADFQERSTFVTRMHFVNTAPNYEYLLLHYGDNLYRLALLPFIKRTTVLHKDGWLEVLWKPVSEAELRARIARKMASYKPEFANSRFSSLRLHYLIEFVQKLKPRGRVVILRLPASREYLDLENALAPEFDSILETAITSAGAEYYSFAEEYPDYETNDGAHLNAASAQKFSERLLSVLKAGHK